MASRPQGAGGSAYTPSLTNNPDTRHASPDGLDRGGLSALLADVAQWRPARRHAHIVAHDRCLELIAVYMSQAPSPIRAYYRKLVKQLVYGALTD